MAYQQRSITGLPPNLFSGGAVVVNPNPVVDYANNVAARNQAKDEAFTKYYSDLGNNLTPSGMHSDEIPNVIGKKSEWQNFNLSHRKTLKDPTLDNGADYATSNRLYNEAIGIARKSQEKVKNLATFKPILDDPKKLALLADDSIKAMHQATLNVTDPNYKPFDLTDIHFNPKPFDLGDQLKVANLLKSRFSPTQNPSITEDKVKGTRTTTFTPSFSDNQLEGMYHFGGSLYASHPGFKAEVDKHASETDPEYDRYNQLFKQYYKPEKGYNENITTPEDMSAAKMLEMNQAPPTKPVTTNIGANSQIAQQNRKDQARFSSNLALGRSETMHNITQADKIKPVAGENPLVKNYLDRFSNAPDVPDVTSPLGGTMKVMPLNAGEGKLFTNNAKSPAKSLGFGSDGKVIVFGQNNQPLGVPITQKQAALYLGKASGRSQKEQADVINNFDDNLKPIAPSAPMPSTSTKKKIAGF